jgi:hypothetical protein
MITFSSEQSSHHTSNKSRTVNSLSLRQQKTKQYATNQQATRARILQLRMNGPCLNSLVKSSTSQIALTNRRSEPSVHTTKPTNIADLPTQSRLHIRPRTQQPTIGPCWVTSICSTVAGPCNTTRGAHETTLLPRYRVSKDPPRPGIEPCLWTLRSRDPCTSIRADVVARVACRQAGARPTRNRG